METTSSSWSPLPPISPFSTALTISLAVLGSSRATVATLDMAWVETELLPGNNSRVSWADSMSVMVEWSSPISLLIRETFRHFP